MRIQLYITVLILIHKSTSEVTSRPSPPANVSIHCDSYGVEVRWEYPDLSPDVSFLAKVIAAVNSENRILLNSTQKLSLNISSMLFDSGTNYYFVRVEATRGGQPSESRDSDIFSFNELVTNAKITCHLDFPEVELSPKDGELLVQFINPIELYRNTPALRDLKDNKLTYTVEAEEGAQKHGVSCLMETKTCETSVLFSEHRGNYCVSLTGQIGQRKLNPRRSCFRGDIRIYPPFTVYLYPVLGVVLTLLFLTVIIMLLVMKYNSEIKKEASSVRHRFGDIMPTQTHFCKPELEICVSDLHIEPDEGLKEQTTLLEIACYSDEEPAAGYKDERSGGSDTVSPYGENDLDDDTEQDDLPDGYDCPHALSLEMSPGDVVKGYGC
ncbi:interferon gamma receptor 1 [Pseudorasbora parva]|uniref:interferon gamma receptor 1 n=1 Tax=Pseudorasbora parva TaxID=51549 RepID=UPI00351EFF7C